MTAPHIVDPATVLEEALGQAWPDLMRSLLQTMINALVSADADAALGRRVQSAQSWAHGSAKRLPAPAPGYQGRNH